MFIQNTFKIITHQIEKNEGFVCSILTGKTEHVLDCVFLLRSLLEKKQIYDINIVDLKEKDVHIIEQELSMSFLGNRAYYFLLNFDSMGTKQKNEYSTLLSHLKSPHVTFIFTTTSTIKNTISCNFSTEYTQQEAQGFIQFFLNRSQKQIDQFLPLLKTKKGKIKLDALLRSLQYMKVVSSHATEFFEEWAPLIFNTDDSFFNLMEYFFAQDIKKFLEIWHVYKDKYSFSFWVAAFSQQLFKATLYVMAQKQHRMAEKEIEFKLPFTFLKKDWKLHSVEKLMLAHHEICMLDIKFKQGEIREDALKLFCIKFMKNLM